MTNKRNDGEVINAGDTYNVQNAVGVGRSVNMENVTINQTQTQASSAAELADMAAQLATLRQALKAQATEPEHDVAVGAIAAAESEAKKGNESKAMEYLSKAGTWALDIATKIGVPVVTEALKRSMMP